MGRIVRSSADCADCLCRVCARNTYNDSENIGFLRCIEYKDCIPCENCEFGETRIVDVEKDCPRWAFLPDSYEGG